MMGDMKMGLAFMNAKAKNHRASTTAISIFSSNENLRCLKTPHNDFHLLSVLARSTAGFRVLQVFSDRLHRNNLVDTAASSA